ncbi:transmembrane protein 177-like [Dermatophagoides pteronyssinus]|uniref:transmembrane protein 177-like n=1 Tax=Dermatophagoides pteronyssinus TaxID=6956 RepID=UPI003F66E567
MLPLLRQKFRNLYDTIRFLPKVTRRRIYLSTSLVTTMTTTGIYVGLQTTKIETFVNHLQMYRMKMPFPVNEKLIDLLNETIKNDGFKFNSKRIDLFNTFGCDIYSIGNVHLPTGAYIGVPFTFNLESIRQLNTDDIRLLGRYKTKRSRDSPVIKQLFESLILSDDAKQFALSHQLHLLSSSYFFIKSLNIMTMTGLYMWLVPKFNRSLGFYESNNLTRSLRLLPRMCGALFCMFLMTTITIVSDQFLDYIYDLNCLRKTIRQNDQHIHGGCEFYQKLIKRNQAMYELLADHGPKFFNKNGDVKRLFGLYTTSYSTHLDFLNSQTTNNNDNNNS